MQQFKVITSHLSGSGGRAHVMGFVPPFPCARRERFPFREAVIWEKSLAGSGYKRVGIRSAYLADRYPYAVCRSESGARGSVNLCSARTEVERRPTERKAFLPNYGNLKRNSPARHRGLARRAKICYTIQLR